MTPNWKKLEDHVRGIASLKWNEECKQEHLNGVDFDGVVRVAEDEIVLIEITREHTLQKVRDDLNKIMPTKRHLSDQGYTCRGYIVLNDEPTVSMVEAGRSAHITVCSSTQFERTFFDFGAYSSLRSKLPFGSAVDSKTGENDPRAFIPVRYIADGGDASLTISDLSTRLLRGEKIALTGDFGSGKSRCVREIFDVLSQKTREAGAFPVAINLRDHWSSSNALEVLAGHLGNVGLASSVDNFVRLLNCGGLILLLDGFDEIGAQTHDVRADDRIALRRHAVRGVRDLVAKSKAGVLVTGRSHFFDSDEEMLQSLGMNSSRAEPLTLTVPDAFTQAEGEAYLRSLGVNAPLPGWLPRKPLVFQVLVELNSDDVTRILQKEHGRFEFWGAFFSAICARESRGVAGSISPERIRHILFELASKTRYSETFLGRLSPKDIDESYERAVGSAPDQTGRQLLSRMCTLGRIEPESPDRQFVDHNVIDVLRAEQLVSEVVGMRGDQDQRQWKQSLRTLGIIHAAALVRTYDLENLCFSYLKKFGASHNTKRLGEVVSLLSLFGDEPLNFQSLQLVHSELPILNLSRRRITNLGIKKSIVNLLVLQNTPIREKDGVVIEDCYFLVVTGISSHEGMPLWIKSSEVVEFEALSNSNLIKESSLSAPQKLFVAIIHKIFFQPGAGREEAALLKGGYGQKYDSKLVDSILKILMNRPGLSRRSSAG